MIEEEKSECRGSPGSSCRRPWPGVDPNGGDIRQTREAWWWLGKFLSVRWHVTCHCLVQDSTNVFIYDSRPEADREPQSSERTCDTLYLAWPCFTGSCGRETAREKILVW